MSVSNAASAQSAELLRLVPPYLWRRRVLVACLAAGVLAMACLACPPWRHELLRSAGRALVSAEPMVPADVIVIAVDADGQGVLEAADLVKAGMASRVALFADPPDRIDLEFERRNIPYHDAAAASRLELQSLGVAQVEVIPRPVTGTEDEAAQLPAWCVGQGYRTVIFVGNIDHTRRTQRELVRSTKGTALKVIVRGSRYSQFDPDRWWESRGGVRVFTVEMQKLLLDVLRHPFG
jgi:hypothetical protein